MVHRSLTSVARYEFNALIQDTKKAVESLKLQEESVVRAIEAAQQAHAAAGSTPDETAAQLRKLEIRLRRLHEVLDQVIAESDGLEALPITPAPGPILALTASDARPSPRSSPVLLSSLKRLRELSERFLKTCCRKVAPLMPAWVKGGGLPCG